MRHPVLLLLGLALLLVGGQGQPPPRRGRMPGVPRPRTHSMRTRSLGLENPLANAPRVSYLSQLLTKARAVYHAAAAGVQALADRDGLRYIAHVLVNDVVSGTCGRGCGPMW